MARGDALESIGDEVAGLPLRLAARLLLELPDTPRELVPDEVFRALEQVRLRLPDRHPGDPLELLQLLVAGLLELLLELLRVRLAVGEPLLAARELDDLRVDLLLPRVQPLLALDHPCAAVGELLLELAPQSNRLLARLDLRLAPERLGLAPRVGQNLLAHASRRAEPGAAPERDRGQRQARADRKSDEYSGGDEHSGSCPWVGWSRRAAATPDTRPARSSNRRTRSRSPRPAPRDRD